MIFDKIKPIEFACSAWACKCGLVIDPFIATRHSPPPEIGICTDCHKEVRKHGVIYHGISISNVLFRDEPEEKWTHAEIDWGFTGNYNMKTEKIRQDSI